MERLVERVVHRELHREGAVVLMKVMGHECPVEILSLRLRNDGWDLRLSVVEQDSFGNRAPEHLIKELGVFNAIFPVDQNIGQILAS